MKRFRRSVRHHVTAHACKLALPFTEARTTKGTSDVIDNIKCTMHDISTEREMVCQFNGEALRSA